MQRQKNGHVVRDGAYLRLQRLFRFFLLFLWTRRIPRTNSGSGWWAISISFALLARLSLILLIPTHDVRLIVSIYAAINILEKPFLLTGLCRFLNLDAKWRWFWLTAALAEVWLLIAWMADVSPFVRNVGYSVGECGIHVLDGMGQLQKPAAEILAGCCRSLLHPGACHGLCNLLI